MGINVLNEYKQHNEFLIEQVKEKNKENNELRKKVERMEMMYENTGAIFNRQYMKEKIERYEDALREIDCHIRSDEKPVPFIIETLKTTLPEYKD